MHGKPQAAEMAKIKTSAARATKVWALQLFGTRRGAQRNVKPLPERYPRVPFSNRSACGAGGGVPMGHP